MAVYTVQQRVYRASEQCGSSEAFRAVYIVQQRVYRASEQCGSTEAFRAVYTVQHYTDEGN